MFSGPHPPSGGLQFSDAVSLVGSSGAEVIFRSQVTPDIKVDIASALRPAPPAPPGLVSKVADWFMRSVVRPEIHINAPGFGIQKVVAPYGKATANYAPLLVAGLAIGVVGAVVAGYYIVTCPKK